VTLQENDGGGSHQCVEGILNLLRPSLAGCSSEGVIVHDILCIVCMQNQERFASADLFDPTDASAAGFYSLNKRNTW